MSLQLKFSLQKALPIHEKNLKNLLAGAGGGGERVASTTPLCEITRSFSNVLKTETL